MCQCDRILSLFLSLFATSAFSFVAIFTPSFLSHDFIPRICSSMLKCANRFVYEDFAYSFSRNFKLQIDTRSEASNV